MKENEKLPDVQSAQPPAHFKLTRVGVTKVKKLVHVKRPDTETIITLPTTLDIFVDLPASQKGSHMSRNLELTTEIVETSKTKPVRDLETFCADIVKSLLDKHEYATFAEVKAQADYFLERKTPSGRMEVEPYKLIAEARAERNGRVRKLIGVEAVGMTACPCAMEVIRAITDNKKSVTVPTHNQRNISTLMIEVPADSTVVEANDLIDIVEHAFSSPTYGMLKRKDEGELVLKAHRNPKFVEDVVRDMLASILRKYSNLPDDTLVIARSESEESIHKHNAFAERITTLGELKK
ncbi:MAG TPA: GTP cyclohydrolase I FolE2 [Thermoplasmatales archaeon]|nr:GTP cyclohydrolase I FolE2 [Thermoplasmatales archaeon]